MSNRVTVRLSEALLAAGARLAFGHDWRPDGVMDAICRFAVKFQPPDCSITEPLIHNFLPWPTQPAMDAELRRDLEQRRVLKVETLGLPKCDWQSPEDETAKAIGLSHMRRELARRTDARVCVGGRTGRGSDAKPLGGFFAGVIEEAYIRPSSTSRSTWRASSAAHPPAWPPSCAIPLSAASRVRFFEFCPTKPNNSSACPLSPRRRPRNWFPRETSRQASIRNACEFVRA